MTASGVDRLAAALDRGLNVSAVQLVALVVAGVGAALGLALGSPSAAVLVPMVSAWLWHWRRRTTRARRRGSRRRAAIDDVDRLIQQLKAGGSLPTEAAGRGRATTPVLADDELVVTTLRVLAQRGGEALPSLERLSDTLRSAQAMEAEARAQAAQATASASVMAALPVVFLVALAVIDGRLRSFYLFHPLGAICLTSAVALTHLGWWLMERLIESVE